VSSSKLEVRAASPDDVPFLASAIRELAAYENMTDQVVLTEDLLTTNLFGPRPYAHSLVGLRDGVPVGYAVYFFSFSTFLAKPGIFLEDLCVLPRDRGTGVGKALLAAVAAAALDAGCARLEWNVLAWNEPAIGFYEGLGAVRNTEWQLCRMTGAPLQNLAALAS
jgi:GNAT superfamily N-acetyltransferase